MRQVSRRTQTTARYLFILQEVAAIGIRLSHASLCPQGHGKLLSNTSIIFLEVRDKLAKVSIRAGKEWILEYSIPQRQRLKMSRRPIRLLAR